MGSRAKSRSRWGSSVTVPSKTIGQFVQDMVATWQANTGITGTFEDGDALLAFWQSVATQLDFLQAQIKLVLALVRAQTSTGGDLDSWMAQFGFTREQPTFASGQVVLGKLVPAPSTITIPVGSIVQTPGGAIQYQVVADATQPTWNAGANGYTLPAGASSLTATVQALAFGSASNVIATQLSQLGSTIPGIDTVTNPAAINNGLDAQSDAAFRAAFVLWLLNLAKATKGAILAAVQGVQQGLRVNLLEDETPQGLPLQGSFTVLIDDGTGSAPANVLSLVSTAVDETRAFGVQQFTATPALITATIQITIRVASGFNVTNVNAAVQAAISAKVNAGSTGQTLYISDAEGAALGVQGVVAVLPGTTINGIVGDLVPTPGQEIRSGVGNITVGNY
jgi:hypothetical protein